ncbi:MAG: CocE/NonD family hydrolase [Alphaproteobacteria bacterium]|nr:CocE/NonD family hydrolase [Alphaproteobacteria bacterium]
MARTVDSFPRSVRSIENEWIPLPDGGQLAARIWLPDDADARPVPAVIEAIPYRKRDFTRSRDEPMHHYVAGHGYACLRIDIRGCGDSDGTISDEYSEEELGDIVDAIAWVARQTWCTGRVGMMGISWGGINTLQVAARRPPALNAVITLCSTDDRYADDAHYMGGCLLNENFAWGSVFFSHAALPPDPGMVGERWRAMWLERIAALRLYPAIWMRHSARDEYWRRGSVCENHDRISCPVFAIGGWADAYTNTVPRLLSGLRVPRRGIVGPWGHAFPHEGIPEPAIGFLQECIRWWDRWLKDIVNGADQEPILVAWMPEGRGPATTLQPSVGRWITERAWPPRERTPLRWHFSNGSLSETPQPSTSASICSPPWVGHVGGSWCAFGGRDEMPGDQRADDRGSLTFDSAPLAHRLEILGNARVTLRLSVDRPQAMIAIRLSEIDQQGTVARITYGLLNLTHRAGSDQPKPLVPGEVFSVQVPLKFIGHAFAAGHRIRLSVSTNYWPIAWPSPQPATITLEPSECFVDLPVRADAGDADDTWTVPPPEQATAGLELSLQEGHYRRRLVHDSGTGTWVFEAGATGVDGRQPRSRIVDIELDAGHTVSYRLTVSDRDPALASATMNQVIVFARDDWYSRLEVTTNLISDANHFVFRADVRAFEGDDVLLAQRQWQETLPRGAD